MSQIILIRPILDDFANFKATLRLVALFLSWLWPELKYTSNKIFNKKIKQHSLGTGSTLSEVRIIWETDTRARGT